MRKWLNEHIGRLDLVFIFCLVLAALLPSINLSGNYILSGDGARDLLDLYRAYQDHILPLVGPSTSVGGFHVGPLFYYLILPPLIISGFNPIAPVIVGVLINALTVAMGYKLLKDFATRRAALYFAVLAIFSPYLIHLARGSWNPNPQPLATLVLLYALMKLVDQPGVKYMMVVGLSIGCGIQLHYTFISNIVTSALILLAFRPRLFMNWKTYAAGGLGLLLPLIPFGVGQAQNGLADIRGLVRYMRGSHVNLADVFNPRLFVEHFMSPATSFFAPINGSQVAVALLIILWLAVLTMVVLAVRKRGPGHKLAAITLLFFGLNALQAHVKNLIHPYYFLFYLIVVLLLIALALDYLSKRWVWAGAGLFGIFLIWEAVTLPGVYRVDRTASALSRAADLIYADATDHFPKDGPPTKIYLESTISGWEAYDYRFFLERRGLQTAFAFEAEYLIIEGKGATQSRSIGGYDQVTVMPTADSSQLVKSIAIYRRSQP